MTDTAIRVERLSTRYRIGQRERYKALRNVLTDAFTAPSRRLKTTDHRTTDRKNTDQHRVVSGPVIGSPTVSGQLSRGQHSPK